MKELVAPPVVSVYSVNSVVAPSIFALPPTDVDGDSSRPAIRAGRAARFSDRPAAIRALLFALLCLLPLSGNAQGAGPAGSGPGLAQDKVDLAVEKAVNFLIRQQDRSGFIQDKDKQKSKEMAITAFALMALASVGHMPADYSPPGKAMDRALNYLLRPGDNSREMQAGYFGRFDGSDMYGHGIITLALTELLGMGKDHAQDTLLRDRVMRGVNVILEAQKTAKRDPRHVGGWRYAPAAPDADLSVSAWQIMALRSANNAGLDVPRNAIEAAAVYLRRSYFSQRDQTGRPLKAISGFGYRVGEGPTYAMTSAGLLAMQVIGGYRLPEVQGAGKWLLSQNVSYKERYFFYGSYYYSQAMKKLGGEFAAHARKQIETILLDEQEPDGSWVGGNDKEKSLGRVYTTSLAVLALSVKHGFLPIYQD